MGLSPFRPDLYQGQTVLITGGGTGICFGIAEALAQHGANLMLFGRRAEVLTEAKAKLEKHGGQVGVFAGDVRNFADVERIVAETVKMFGRLDVLVNGAAGNFLCPTEKLSPNGFKTVIDIDLLGTFNMARAAFEALKKSRGVILNISATLHYQGTLMQAPVMAAKAGIDALGRNLAAEWGEYGIRVVTIAPGPIGDTEGVRRLLPGAAADKAAADVPLRRLGKVQDIANAALFLCSSAASYITGEVLVVDGGQWLATPPFVSRAEWEQLAAKPRS